MSPPVAGFLSAQPARMRASVRRGMTIRSCMKRGESMKFEDEPVDLGGDADEDLPNDMKELQLFRVDGAATLRASGEEQFLVLGVDDQPHGDTRVRALPWKGGGQVAVDRHLALSRGPHDG